MPGVLPSIGCWMFGQRASPTDVSCSKLDPAFSYEGYIKEVSLWSKLLTTRDVRRGLWGGHCFFLACI